MLIQLFVTFFRIGLFTIGSGYAMVPLIQREVVDRRGWFTESEFLDQFALAQSSPGPFALNTAVFVGYKMKGFSGALCAMLGVILPSFFIMLLIALYLNGIRENRWVNAAFEGMRPAVLALIAVPFVRYLSGMKWCGWVLALTVTVVIWAAGISPVYLILGAGASGVLLAFCRRK
ncbi:MAG: chromate transporter [Alistipes sp.]|nr:chromate transporter [Candidatus Minthomonas equi]